MIVGRWAMGNWAVHYTKLYFRRGFEVFYRGNICFGSLTSVAHYPQIPAGSFWFFFCFKTLTDLPSEILTQSTWLCLPLPLLTAPAWPSFPSHLGQASWMSSIWLGQFNTCFCILPHHFCVTPRLLTLVCLTSTLFLQNPRMLDPYGLVCLLLYFYTKHSTHPWQVRHEYKILLPGRGTLIGFPST